MSNEQKIALLKRKRELLLQRQSRQDDSFLGRASRFIPEQFPELVKERGLVPESYQQIGKQIEEVTPEQIRPGLQMASNIAKQSVMPGLAPLLSKMAIEKPMLSLRAGSLVNPIARGPELAGLGTRLAVQQIVPPTESPLPGLVAEGVGGLTYGLGRGAIKGIGSLRNTASTKTLAQQAILDTKDEIADLKVLQANKKVALVEKANRAGKKIENVTAKAKDVFKQGLIKKSQEAAEAMQQKLLAFYKEGSKTYGKTLDKMISSISTKSARQVTRQNIINIVKKSLGEAEEALITDGQGYRALKSLLEKYSKTAVKGAKGQFQKLGKLDLADVVNDLKNVKKLMSSGAKSGTSRLTPEDIPIEILRKNLGDFINDVTGKQYNTLNKAYGDFMDLVKTSNRTFKPYKGALEAKQGAGLITRVAKGTASGSERKLLDELSKGTKLAKGIGRVDDDIISFTNKMNRRMAQLEGRASNLSTAQKRATRTAIDKISKDIASKNRTIEEVTQLLSDATRAEKYLKRLGIGGLTLVGAGGGAGIVSLLKKVVGAKGD